MTIYYDKELLKYDKNIGERDIIYEDIPQEVKDELILYNKYNKLKKRDYIYNDINLWTKNSRLWYNTNNLNSNKISIKKQLKLLL